MPRNAWKVEERKILTFRISEIFVWPDFPKNIFEIIIWIYDGYNVFEVKTIFWLIEKQCITPTEKNQQN